MDITNAPEITTLVYCHGCEQFSLAGDCAENRASPTKQLHCPRCGSKVHANHVLDYVDKRVVEYE